MSCRVTLPNGTHAINVEAGGYYTGSAEATVRVAKATKKVNAIGFLSHLSTVFAIDKRYAEIVYGKDGRAYRISADDVESIGFSSDGKRAELRFKADLWDHTRILRPVRVGRSLTLQISLSESGKGSDRLLALGRRHARPRAAREDAGRGVRHDPLRRLI